MMLEQAIGILAEAAVGRTPRRLHVGDAPMRRAKHAEKRLRVHRAGADFDVERLLQGTPARSPELRQLQNEILKSHQLQLRRRNGSWYLVLCPWSVLGPTSVLGPVSLVLPPALRTRDFGRTKNEVLGTKHPSYRRISRNTRTDFKSFSRCIAIRSRCAPSSSLS